MLVKSNFIFLALILNVQTLISSLPLAQAAELPIQNVTKENFRELVDLVRSKYEPEFSSIGKKFELEVLVNEPENRTLMKSEAELQGRHAIVRMYGGLPRHIFMTIDALALILCHEVGHHLGGAPKKSFDQSWSSAEGQADYWATNVCLGKLWEGQDHQLYLPQTIPPTAVELCRNQSNAALCLRELMASQVMTDVLKTLKRMNRTIDFDHNPPLPDVGATKTDDPAVACRFKTYIAGVLNQERPACWFKD